MEVLLIRCDECRRLLVGDEVPGRVGEGTPPLYLAFTFDNAAPGPGWYRDGHRQYSLPVNRPLAFCDTACFAKFVRDHIAEGA